MIFSHQQQQIQQQASDVEDRQLQIQQRQRILSSTSLRNNVIQYNKYDNTKNVNDIIQSQQQSQYHDDQYDANDQCQQHSLSHKIQEESNAKTLTTTETTTSSLTRNDNIIDCRHDDRFLMMKRHIQRFLISKLLLFIILIHIHDTTYGCTAVDAKVTTTSTKTTKSSFALHNMRIFTSKTNYQPFLLRNKSNNDNKIFSRHNNVISDAVSSLSLSSLQIRTQQLHKQPYQNRITQAKRISLNSLLRLPRGGSRRQDDEDDDDEDEDEQNYDEEDDDDDMLFDSNDMMMNDGDDTGDNNFMEDPSSQTNIISRFLDTWNNKTPPITKWYLSCSVIITLYSYIFNKNQYPNILLYNGKIIQLLYMPWKFITAFFYFGPLSIGYCMTLQFLYVYMSTLERLNYYKPYDFIIMILFGQCCMIFGYTVLQLNSQLLGHNLSTYLVYIWSRYHEGLEVNMFELFNTKAEYLPWFFIAQTYLLENEIPILDILGILFGHIYHHYYTIGILHAPLFIKNWYENSSNPIAIKFRKLYQSVSTDFEHQ